MDVENLYSGQKVALRTMTLVGRGKGSYLGADRGKQLTRGVCKKEVKKRGKDGCNLMRK